MKAKFITFLCLLSFFSINAQTLLEIENDKITLDEFKNVFFKNSHDEEIDKKYLDEYMDLFINFKLKVYEAKKLKMDTITSFINELEGYAEQLSIPYLKNKEFDESLVNEAYERMKLDVRASHILLSVPKESTQKEENDIYNKIIDIRNEIKNNKINFSDAAKKYSDDKSALVNGGDLGYFTAFMMVYDFETAAYNTAVGEISMPVKTKYGYHIISVSDKRNAIGEVKVSHIMFKTGEGADEKKINSSKERINEIYENLIAGELFEDLAERFSEDRSTAVNGGALPAFGVGKMVSEFEKNAFKLKNIGDFSKPFRTKFGWHIVKLLEKNPVPLIEESKEDIIRKIQRDGRNDLSKEALFSKLRKEYKIKHNSSVFSSIRKVANKDLTNGSWNGNYTKNNEILFYIDDHVVTLNLFIEYLIKNQSVGSNIDKMYQDFLNISLLNYEKSQLENKYPEYKALINEYKEGILLFDLTNKKVWKKAVEDTVGLNEFFQQNKDNYTWDDRVEATIYTCNNINTSLKVRAHIFKNKLGLESKNDDLLSNANENNPLSLKIESKKYLKGDNKFIDELKWVKGTSSNIKQSDNSIVIIDIHNVLPKTYKTLEETKGKVISDYQSELESAWINVLRNKYSVNVNKEVLYSIIK
tara:strand:+ start:704 stop:2632 length:1929 start_codon:yes stop_codon:yes gene_type:complete